MATLLSAFPTTEPAIIVKLNATTVSPLGVIHTGSKLFHFETPTGTIETVPGFEPAFKAEVIFGGDWLSFDPDGQFGRIDLKAIAKTDDGHSISFGYVGVIAIDEGVGKIFGFAPDAATVPFGNAMGSYTFVVADPRLKVLENSMWASSGRIAVTPTGLVVENLVSKIVGKRVTTETVF